MDNKIFPQMDSMPEKTKILALIPCWWVIFVLLPMFMPLAGFGLWEKLEASAWLDLFYHIASGILVLFIIGDYLKEDWFMVTTDARHYLGHVALTIGMILAANVALLTCLYIFGFDITGMLESFPITEMSISQTSLLLISTKPVFGTIALSLFSPITMCGLFYCLGFAPICSKKPWPAYLCITVITMIPPAINILWRDEIVLSICSYIVGLPIHLIACWSYQKTDNIWTPLLSLVVVNLLASAAILILLPTQIL